MLNYQRVSIKPKTWNAHGGTVGPPSRVVGPQQHCQAWPPKGQHPADAKGVLQHLCEGHERKSIAWCRGVGSVNCSTNWVLGYGDFMRIWGFPEIGRPNHPPPCMETLIWKIWALMRLNGAAWDVSMYHLCLRWSKHAYITYIYLYSIPVYPLLWPLKNRENDENPSHFGAPYMVCKVIFAYNLCL